MIEIIFLTLPLFAEEKLSAWIEDIAQHYDFEINTILIHFVSEETLLSLNQQFLNHDTDTDIITFDYSSEEESKTISTDIYISEKMLLFNAKKHRETNEKEMLRLISHGILHCVGFKDKKENEKKKMRLEEEKCIKMFHVKR